MKLQQFDIKVISLYYILYLLYVWIYNNKTNDIAHLYSEIFLSNLYLNLLRIKTSIIRDTKMSANISIVGALI